MMEMAWFATLYSAAACAAPSAPSVFLRSRSSSSSSSSSIYIYVMYGNVW